MIDASQDNDVKKNATAGRVPLRSSERVYKTYGSFLWTCTAFSAATWAFLIGSFLPYVWDARIGSIGYLAGLMIGLAVMLLAAGLPPYKYGLDTIDGAKAAFGPIGVVVPMFGLLATCIGWSYVLLAFTGKGGAVLLGIVAQASATPNQYVVVASGLVAIIVVWLVAIWGPSLFERLGRFIAPTQLIIASVVLGILYYKHGSGLWDLQVAPDKRLAASPIEGFAIAVEFGMSNAFTWWPLMGGLTRLVAKRSNLVGPIVLGGGVLGAAFISMVAAFASLSAGVPDPTIWIISICGPVFGSIVMIAMLVANVATVVILLYLAGVSIQQIRPLAGLRWGMLIGIILLPATYFVYETEWTLSVVMNWLSYNGVLFVGVAGVTLIDYLVLRKEHLNVPHLFVRSEESAYWFWGGINWVAIAVALGTIPLDMWLVDPSTSHTNSIGRWVGAGIPSLIVAAAAYYIVMKLWVLPTGVGHYRDADGSFSKDVSPSL